MSYPTSLLSAALALQAEAAARRVLPPLESAGIAVIVLKGPALAAWLYRGEEARRTYGDLDLLVPPEGFEQAGACLSALGYERGQAGWEELSFAWSRPEGGMAIDLHRSLVGAEAAPPVVWRRLASHSVRRSLLGLECRCLDETGLAMHVATHAAQHGLDGAGKPLEDLRRALEVAGDEVWRDAAGLASRIDAEPAFAAGLRRLPEGAGVAARLGLTRDLPLDVALRASPQPPSLVLGLEQLRRISGARSRARFIASKVFPSAAQMRGTSRIAARSRAGLITAYAMRPLQAALGLPGALLRHRSLTRASQPPEDRPDHVDDR